LACCANRKKLNIESVDLYGYIDECEKLKASDGYFEKEGMEHIINQMKNKRKDPMYSNLNVARFFKSLFGLSFFASLFLILSLFTTFLL